MSKVSKQLEKMVSDHGPAKVAVHIGQTDTQNLKRWIREKEMPRHLESIVEKIIELKGSPK